MGDFKVPDGEKDLSDAQRVQKLRIWQGIFRDEEKAAQTC